MNANPIKKHPKSNEVNEGLTEALYVLMAAKSYEPVLELTQNQNEKEVLSITYLPFFIILLLMLIIGTSPSVILVPIQNVVQVLYTSPLPVPAADIHPVVSNVGTASLLLILLIGAVSLIRSKIAGKRISYYSQTWGCGYITPSVRMQYTGKSFSKNLAKLFSIVIREEKKYDEIEPNDVFPVRRSYQSSYAEFFEKNIINKVSNQLLHLMNQFTFIHNGQVQMYVLYGFIFVMILILATFFNIL